ncbi:MAG: propionyl-coenzyme A carboxylase alpha polypeptide, partial [Mesorhizobium sp.]
PPSVLPDISPARGEIGRHCRFRQSPTLEEERRRRSVQPIDG